MTEGTGGTGWIFIGEDSSSVTTTSLEILADVFLVFALISALQSSNWSTGISSLVASDAGATVTSLLFVTGGVASVPADAAPVVPPIRRARLP